MYKHTLEYDVLEDFGLDTYEDDPIYEFEVEESINDVIEHFLIESAKEYPLTTSRQRFLIGILNTLYLDNKLDMLDIYNTPAFKEFLKDKYQLEAINEYRKNRARYL